MNVRHTILSAFCLALVPFASSAEPIATPPVPQCERGVVTVELMLNTDGSVKTTKLLSSTLSKGNTERALRAIKVWKYGPETVEKYRRRPMKQPLTFNFDCDQPAPQSNQPLHPTPSAAEAPASGAGERRR